MKRLFLIAALFAAACNNTSIQQTDMKQETWQEKFTATLPLLGHRNWILIVDKAFPLQTAPGVEVIYTGEKLLPVAAFVIDAVNKSNHVKGIYYVDKELEYMTDDLSQGVSEYKKELYALTSQAAPIMHEEVFKMIEEASVLFKIIVLKTDEVIPYSSVFINLDCGYWTGEKEQTLREKMK